MDIMDISKIVFIPMPIGTGNDFSQNLNLGSKINLNTISTFIDKI